MPDDHRLAADLAGRAGAKLLDLRERRAADVDGRSLGRAGDRLSHEYLSGELSRVRPADAVLSEEGKDDPARLSAERVWIVDPLDGTREYGEPGRTDWAVHVALWSRDDRGGELVAGAVALPAQGRLLSTEHAPARPADITRSAMRITVSRTRPPEFVPAVVAALEEQGTEVELVPLGSAGAKIVAVVLGDVDAYVHAGGQYEWDSAAPVAVARTAGMHCSRIDSSALGYNRADPSLPDILVARPGVAGRLLDVVAMVCNR